MTRDLYDAQHAYMKLTGAQISQTEVQRLAGALCGGMSIADAVKQVHEFFSTPINWDAERKSFSEWLAKRRRGTIDAKLTVSVQSTLTL